MQGSDRWQPPNVPNTDEILVRPEPIEEEAEQDQQGGGKALTHPEAIPASAADDDVVATSAAAVGDKEVQQDVGAQEKEQLRHRQRSGSLCLYWP